MRICPLSGYSLEACSPHLMDTSLITSFTVTITINIITIKLDHTSLDFKRITFKKLNLSFCIMLPLYVYFFYVLHS